jgi:hypothetical protein
MDSSTVLNLVAFATSIVALVVSGLLARQQSTMMRHGNELPVLVDLLQEFRSRDFQEAEHYVLNRLAAETDPSSGSTELPVDPRLAVNYVASFFTSLGALVCHRMVDEEIVVAQFGFRARRAWCVLEKYVDRERQIRHDPFYARPFEHLARLVQEGWPPDTRYHLKLKTVPRKTSVERDPPDPSSEVL